MHILDVSQVSSTGDWLMERVGRSTGTKSGDIAASDRPESTTTDPGQDVTEVPSGFWSLLAEVIADPATMENAADRGHRLENDNAMLVLDREGIDPATANLDPGLWVSDEDERLACSPDCHEDVEEPTWAIECKSLSSPNHLSYVVPYIMREALEGRYKTLLSDSGYATIIDDVITAGRRVLPLTTQRAKRPYDFVPDKYKAQALQYFVVCPSLKTLYFSFYDPRVSIEVYRHVYLTITRDSVEFEVQDHSERQLHALTSMDTMKRLGETIDKLSAF